ncbi:MAG: hypothetical protein ACI8S6_004536 [Myxococcota bacterium]|jgi:hypothetical protein
MLTALVLGGLTVAHAQEGVIAGSSTALGATVAHAIVWQLYPNRQSSMVPHYIPIAGPIAGFRERSQAGCSAEQGCPDQAAMAIFDGFTLGVQTAGLALTFVAVVVGHTPSHRIQLTPTGASLTW